MPKTLYRGLAIAIAMLLPSCALVVPSHVTPKEEVTIPAAMKSIACGLKTYQNELAKLDLNTGGILDTTEVTLVLKASADGTSTLVVDGKSPSVGVIAPIGVNYTDKLEQAGSRENTIKLTFKNMMTASINDTAKAQLKGKLPPLAPGPSESWPVDKPCEPVKLPASYRLIQRQP